MMIKHPEEIKIEAINRMLVQSDRLNTLGEIIAFTGIPKRTFYRNKYSKKLRESGIIFSRKGPYGKEIYWSYKQLVIAWLAENFSHVPKNT